MELATPQPDGSFEWKSVPINSFVDRHKIYAEKNGATWFGTGDGIIKYDFGKKNLGNTDYAALVRRVDIGEDSTIYFGGKLDNPVTPEITFKNNSATFRYAATSYEGKNINQFKTFLDGFDDGWSPYSTETKKEYTNLPPGKYTFKVAALNPSGIESSTGTYSFEILPPWYRTWWAYGFMCWRSALEYSLQTAHRENASQQKNVSVRRTREKHRNWKRPASSSFQCFQKMCRRFLISI